MEKSTAREKYRNIRYEYYHSGRTLYSSGCFLSGGILLGYAVETTLKAGLLEVLSDKEKEKNGGNKILWKSHDVVEILKECKKYGIFNEIDVSSDFLENINNNFQRYPSQQYHVFKRATKSNIVLCHSTDYVYYYDDLIIQLDYCLFKFTSDISISMMYHAYQTLQTKYAQDFLFENAFALKFFEEMEQEVKDNLPLRDDLKQGIIENFNRGYNYYWKAGQKSEQVEIEVEMRSILEQYKSKEFKFKKWEN